MGGKTDSECSQIHTEVFMIKYVVLKLTVVESREWLHGVPYVVLSPLLFVFDYFLNKK